MVAGQHPPPGGGLLTDGGRSWWTLSVLMTACSYQQYQQDPSRPHRQDEIKRPRPMREENGEVVARSSEHMFTGGEMFVLPREEMLIVFSRERAR